MYGMFSGKQPDEVNIEKLIEKTKTTLGPLMKGLYDSFIESGFDKEQAMYLTGLLLHNLMSARPK